MRRRKIIDDEDRVEVRKRTVAEIGEFAVIDRATRGRVQTADSILGPGDDAAVVAASDGRVVVTTDMLVQGRHFRLDWSSPVDIGRKAIAQNGADIAAMGARCTGFLVALGCPADTPLFVTDGINEGLWREASRAGAGIVGGDLVQSDSLVISITALGDLGGRSPILRSGAEPGDVVAVSGRLGWSAGGLAVLLAGSARHHSLVELHCAPQPDYLQGISAAVSGATSLTDVSDGLIADLDHIAEASSVAIDLHSESITLDDEIVDAAHDLGSSALDWALTGGEDHSFAGTFPADASLPDGWIRIGWVREGAGVTVDGRKFSGGNGWSSFST
ncbi:MULTISPECIES: thiamine-phosphate kinase [unclassified Rhodococcus (in: high G+C Gram-positive bacteria)]|uniref:thiamine-phosphate kinase n=1 Tax=Rhodococcus sp. PAMC28707 TaxID=2565560 RepID=UPI001FF8A169|nr:MULTISPECIES: thiamine-phosphate kinase [unclassified Rhodococcus (in: high G+C Gram-positive bacteria)]